ncbi:hypothetical protein FQA39_LY11828 [Lamprigera yunnana]|nr:hypothetical protein FQA39_LY11828 [Lamprigera yunnana]
MATKDLSSYKDLSEHFSNSRKIISQLSATKNNNKHLLRSVQQLQKEADFFKVLENNLVSQLKILCKSEAEDDLRLMHSKLKDKYISLESKYSTLCKKYNMLQEQHLLDMKFREGRDREENRLKKELVEKVKSIQLLLLEEKNICSKKEKDFNNKLETLQALHANQCEDFENGIKSLHLQLKNALDSHSIHQNEYTNFKNQSSVTLNIAYQKINELENKLKLSEQEKTILKEKLKCSQNLPYYNATSVPVTDKDLDSLIARSSSDELNTKVELHNNISTTKIFNSNNIYSFPEKVNNFNVHNSCYNCKLETPTLNKNLSNESALKYQPLVEICTTNNGNKNNKSFYNISQKDTSIPFDHLKVALPTKLVQKSKRRKLFNLDTHEFYDVEKNN